MRVLIKPRGDSKMESKKRLFDWFDFYIALRAHLQKCVYLKQSHLLFSPIYDVYLLAFVVVC